MPGDPSISSNDVLRVGHGAISWGPAVGFKDGALALVDKTTNSGKREFSLMRLDAAGRLVAESTALPLKKPTAGGAIVILGSEKALMAVHDGKEERFTAKGMACCFYYNQPRWFQCSWKAKKVKFEEIDFWKGMHARNITAKSQGNNTTWTMSYTTYQRQPKVASDSRLAFGFSSGPRPPQIHQSEVPCHGVAHIAESPLEILALVNSEYKDIKLWRLTAEGQVSEIASISPPEQRQGEVSEPAIFSLPDGYLFLWRFFNKKVKKEQRDGSIWLRTCDRTLNHFDQPRRLSDHREVPAGEWLACDLGHSGLVVWANGLSRPKQQIHFVRIGSRSDLPKQSRAFPGALPNHVLATKRGVLALSTIFSTDPYFWRLKADDLGDLK
jgi:hypothetical protein